MSFAGFDEINLVRSGCPLLCGLLTKRVSQGVGPDAEMVMGLLPQLLLPPSCRRAKCCAMQLVGHF